MLINSFHKRVISSCGISLCLAVVTIIYFCLTHFESSELNLFNYSAYYYFLVKTLYDSIIAHIIPSFSIFYLFLIIGLVSFQYATGANFIKNVQSTGMPDDILALRLKRKVKTGTNITTTKAHITPTSRNLLGDSGAGGPG
ncbi:40936_t:CDS:2, partial [Gigaspora margarita]